MNQNTFPQPIKTAMRAPRAPFFFSIYLLAALALTTGVTAQPASYYGITAHRGGAGLFPENTIPAFRNAIALKVDWAELDIFRTKDGKLVVTHDPRTGRVADKDLEIAASTYDELRKLDVATDFRKRTGKSLKECPPQQMPLLEDVLALFIRQKVTKISIQPKADCVPEAMAIVRKMNAQPIVGFNDGNLRYMSQVKELEPKIPVFWDRPAGLDLDEDIRIAREKKFEALVVNSKGLNAEKIQKIKKAGFVAGAWTVNDPNEMKELLAAGIDRIYTDEPAALISLRYPSAAVTGSEARHDHSPDLNRPAAAGEAQLLRTFDVGKAQQAVAVDKDHFYVINSSSITRHSKATGEKVLSWDGTQAGIVHLNSGIVHKGKLYCANSNFPGSPMSSSIEIFDAQTLRPVGSKSLGIDPHGSLTWVDFYDGHWWLGFAHYSGRHMAEGKDNRYTTVVRYDSRWHKTGAWSFPEEVIRSFGNYSNSGGVWASGNRLLCTGHDAAEIYVMSIPAHGYTLKLAETIKVPAIAGQGIAIDKSEKNRTILYGIIRSAGQVTVSEIK